MAGHALNDGDLVGSADAIFVGTLASLGIETKPREGFSAFWRVKINILKMLKGRIASADKFTITINVAGGEGPPTSGKIYLFYAKKVPAS